jgi:hypothetical protein
VQTSVQTFGHDNTLISQGDDYMTYSAVDPTDLGPGLVRSSADSTSARHDTQTLPGIVSLEERLGTDRREST